MPDRKGTLSSEAPLPVLTGKPHGVIATDAERALPKLPLWRSTVLLIGFLLELPVIAMLIRQQHQIKSRNTLLLFVFVLAAATMLLCGATSFLRWLAISRKVRS